MAVLVNLRTDRVIGAQTVLHKNGDYFTEESGYLWVWQRGSGSAAKRIAIYAYGDWRGATSDDSVMGTDGAK